MEKSILYIGHYLPYNNNIYEESLIRELNKHTKNLNIVSINKSRYSGDVSNIKVLHTVRLLLIDGILRFFEFLFYIIKWVFVHRNNNRVVIVLSPTLEVNLVCVIIKKLFGIKVVNLIIDTALGNTKRSTFVRKYICKCFELNEKLYKYMTASMALNSNVFKYLKLDNKPCLHTKIGHNLLEEKFIHNEKNGEKNTIVYTGTLTDYDGTEQLLKAMDILSSDEYCLHIYGKGPYQKLVEQYQSNHKNIKFFGYLNNSEMKKVMQDADLLINPRIDNKYTDIFGFPSKMIEYLLSGTPVLTTRFAAMPKDYEEFVYIIETQTGEGIAEAIEKVFADSQSNITNKCKTAYNYILENNKYSDIVNEMIVFIDQF
jgi:glycosyltransferase involved in cell wall biosynthesis